MIETKIKNPNFEDQMTEVKIRDSCDMRRCTQVRPTEQIYVFISMQFINNVEFRI